MVISSNPTSSNGLSTWSLNLLRFLLLASTINSVMGCSDKDLRRVSTWSRLGPDLVLNLCGRPEESRRHPVLGHVNHRLCDPVLPAKVSNPSDA